MTKYFTQFEEAGQVIDTNLTGWTTRGTVAPTSYAPAYGTPAVKRRYLAYKCNNSGIPMRNIVSWNSIDADANRANVELLGCFSKDATTCTDVTLWARGVGASGAVPTECYEARCNMAGNTIYIEKRGVSALVLSAVASTAFTFSSGKSYFVRFRVNGTSLKLRVWDAALGMANEPSTWNIDTTDTAWSTAGWVGVGGIDGGTGGAVAPWNFLAVATNGDTAVCPRTNAEYLAWLDDQTKLRCVLAEMSATGYDSGGSPYTKTVNVYLSNHGYTSQQQDTPSLRHYDNFIQQIPTFTREMSTALSGQATTGFGDLIISNPVDTLASGGVRDNWLRMKWNRNYLKLYLGDPSWPKHDFRLMIYGRVGMPSAPSLGQIKFPIADLSDFFNAPIVTQTYTSGDRENERLPLILGYAYVIEPVLIDKANLLYAVSQGTVFVDQTTGEDVVMASDNTVELKTTGLVIASVSGNTMTATSAHGMTAGYRVRFTAGTPPTGLSLGVDYYVIATGLTTTAFQLSATVGGSAVVLSSTTTGATFTAYGYRFGTATHGSKTITTMTLVNQPAGRILLRKVISGSSFPGSNDVGSVYLAVVSSLSANFKDTTGLAALTLATSDWLTGMWLDGQSHLIGDVLAEYARGVVGWYGMTTDGLFTGGLIGPPAATAVASFAESDVLKGSLRLVDVIRAIDFSVVQVSSGKMFFTQGPLQVGAANYLAGKTIAAAYSYGASSTPLDNFPNNSDSNTSAVFDLLITGNTAATRRDQLVTLYQANLGVFEFTTRLSASQLNIGDTISLTHSRYHWKQWTGADDASPDNTATIDSRLAVVIGIAVDVARGTTKIKCFRRIPGYYPTTDLN